MTNARLLCSLAIAASFAARVCAQDPPPVEPNLAAADPDIYDATIGLGLTGGTEVQINEIRPGEIGTSEFEFSAGLTLPAGEYWSVRYGLTYETREFQTTGRIPFAQGKGLHVLALNLRATREVGDDAILIFGVMPGSYGQEYNFDEDFSCPGFLSLAYRPSDTLTLVAGVRYNERGENPWLPVAGVRWSPSPRFRVQLVFPRTTIEYDWSDRTRLFFTASFQETVYRVDDARLRNLDERRNELRDRLTTLFPDVDLPPILTSEEFDYPSLVNTEVRFRDVQAGFGLSWRLGESWRFEVEGGVSPERSLDFSNAGVRIDLLGEPYYFRVGFHGGF